MTDKEKLNKLKELADKMAHSSEYLASDASHLHKAVYEYRQFIIQHLDEEEPVSEDLDDVIQYLNKLYPEVSFAKLLRIVVYAVRWQKEKTIKWLTALNNEHEIMSYTDSHNLETDELISYYKNYMED